MICDLNENQEKIESEKNEIIEIPEEIDEFFI